MNVEKVLGIVASCLIGLSATILFFGIFIALVFGANYAVENIRLFRWLTIAVLGIAFSFIVMFASVIAYADIVEPKIESFKEKTGDSE